MKLRHRSIVAAGLLSLTTATVEARVDLPPRGDLSVHDLAGVISPDDRQTMEHSHRDLRAQTGVVLSVVTLQQMEGDSLEEVLQRAGPEWGLGREMTDTGIVVALSMQEHSVLIATGHGVEEFLPDARVQKIIKEVILPRLYRSDVSHAMLHASSALIASFVVVLFFVALGMRPLVLKLLARRAPVPQAPRRSGQTPSRKGPAQ